MPPKIILKLNKLPQKSGVYVLKDKDDSVLYITKTKDIKEAVTKYFIEKNTRKSKYIRKYCKDLDYYVIDDDYEATTLELKLIKQYHPPLNRRRDDEKQYRFVFLTTNENFPRAKVVKLNEPKSQTILGPFPKNRHIKRVLRVAVNHFEIADCGKKIVLGDDSVTIQTCLRRKTKQCLRPCEVEIDEIDYRDRVNRFINFFRNENDEVEESIKQEMTQLVKNQEYEKAAKLRDDLEAIERVFMEL